MPLDEADKKFITELLAQNTAALEKRFVTPDAATKMVEQSLAKGLEGLKLDEKLAAALKGAKPADEDGDKAGKGKQPDGKVDPEVQRLRSEMEAIKAQSAEATAKQEAAEAKARNQQLEAAAREALAKQGVPPERQAHALAWLRNQKTDDGKPILDVDATGKAVWRAQRKGYVDELGLEDGLKSWAGSDDGKHFLPATGHRGTGDSVGQAAGHPGPSTVPRRADGSLDTGAVSQRVAEALRTSPILT